jgi:hypothetical protein
MKKGFRCLVFFSLILLMSFGTRPSTSSSAAPLDKVIDPACVSFCIVVMQGCITSGHDQRSCLGVYHHCLAHCGKN